MTDIALNYDSDNREFDIAIDAPDLKSDDGLRTAVIISLFSDMRAEDDDELPDGTDNKRGFWADGWPDIEGDKTGSRLWLLSRSKETTDVLVRAEEYAIEALQWLIDDGVAVSVDVTAEHVERTLYGLLIIIKLVTGGSVEYNLDYSTE